ncbi:MAG TPA: TIGR04255 family protein [Gammaproteobacteria bacterium]
MSLSSKLSNAPLVYVLAQVKFSPIADISPYIPKIQEALRKEYPRFDPIIRQGFQWSIGGSSAPEVLTVREWDFSNKAKTTGISLSSSSLVMQTTAYTHSDDFFEQFERSIEVVGSIMEPALVQRIGLRYIDFIVPEGDKALDAYISPGLMGLASGALDSKCLRSISETVIKTEVGQLVCRCILANHASPIPSDLMPLRLALKKEPDSEKRTAILDTDHFSEKEFDFDPKSIVKNLRALHTLTSKSFKTAVTQAALKEWE